MEGKASNPEDIQKLKRAHPDDSSVIYFQKWALSENALAEKQVRKNFLETILYLYQSGFHTVSV